MQIFVALFPRKAAEAIYQRLVGIQHLMGKGIGNIDSLIYAAKN